MTNNGESQGFAVLRSALPGAVLVFGLVLTGWIWSQQVALRDAEFRAYFDFRSRDALERVEARLRQYEQALIDTQSLFSTLEDVSAATFTTFFAASRVHQRFPGIQGIGFAKVTSAKADGEGLRSSIVFLEPVNERNKRALGYDMYSEATRREAMSRATDTGEPALSGKVRLVQETGVQVQAGFLLYVPVYGNGTTPQTTPERRKDLRGWVYAPFRINDFLAGVLGEAADDLDFEVYDGETPSPGALMYDRVPGAVAGADPLLRSSQELNFAGHSWTLVTQGLQGLIARQGTDLSFVVLVLGAAISVLLALLGQLVSRQFVGVQKQNRSLTAEVDESSRTLYQEQKRLASIIRGTNVGTWEWNVQTGETIFNERWAQITGYTLDELAPVSIDTWGSLVHPEDVHKSEAALERHFQGELDYYVLECRMRHKEGHWVWVLDSGAVASKTPDGKPEWMFGTHTDITERKEAEAALRNSEEKLVTLFKLLPVGVVLTDDAGRIIEANAASQVILGLTVAETLARAYDSPSWVLVRADGTPMPPEEFASVRALTEHRTVSDVEMGVLRPDGTVRWLLTSSSPVPVPGLGVCIVFIDITDRKNAQKAQSELEAQNQQLKKGQSLAQMAGAVAHLFNNKLQAVLAGLELAKTVGPGEASNRHLQRAESAAHSAGEVSRLLLAYLGQASVDREPCVVAPVVSEVVTTFHRTLPEAVVLSAEALDHGLQIRVNTEQLRQVLTQLLANALESLVDTRGAITVNLKLCDPSAIPSVHRFPLTWRPSDQEYACLEVSDTGEGIAEPDLEKLFDPFYTTKFTGRGLGLAVIYGIVKAHGGAITVESHLGRGSSFRVYLPLLNMEVARPEPIPGSERRGLGPSVLLVDDEEALRDAIGELLESMGYPVLTAKDGLDALKVYEEHRDVIGCVLSDLTMPNLDGWGLLNALRKLEPELPVILASGYDRDQVLSGDHAEVPSGFVGKPFDVEEIQRVFGSIGWIQ